jgi:uncharacterized protein
MKISGEQTLSAPRASVWALFNDPNRLSRLIPGCEKLDILGPDEFSGTMNVGIAAVKGVYTGKIKLDEKREPEHYKMLIDAKGKQGFVRGSGTLDLDAANPKTTIVKYAGDVQIGGPLMQVGQRLVESASKMMLGQFFAAAEAELRAAAVGEVARQGILINFWRYLVRLFKSFTGKS